jgi:hypothetical protein
VSSRGHVPVKMLYIVAVLQMFASFAIRYRIGYVKSI